MDLMKLDEDSLVKSEESLNNAGEINLKLTKKFNTYLKFALEKHILEEPKVLVMIQQSFGTTNDFSHLGKP